MVKHKFLSITMSDNFVISKIIQNVSFKLYKEKIYGEFDPGSE